MDTLLARVASFLAERGIQAYVVGGAVRDRLLETSRRDRIASKSDPGASSAPHDDIDLAVSAPIVELADEIAAAVGATAVVTDAERGHIRLIAPGQQADAPAEKYPWVDLAGFVGDIVSDLGRRDLTINAMAIPLDRWASLTRDALIDPHSGALDLRRRLIRETLPGNLVADPVRLLRAVRLATRLDFEIESSTAAVIEDNAGLVAGAAGERTRDEFFELVGGRRPVEAVRMLDRLGLLDILLPELTRGRGFEQPSVHYYDVMEHQLHALEIAEQLLDPVRRSSHPILSTVPWKPEFDDYFRELIADGQTRGTLLKTVALLHDIGKPGSKTVDPPTPGDPKGRVRFLGHELEGALMARGLFTRFKCSRRTISHVSLMIEEHLRPFHMSMNPAPPTDRAILRYFRDVSPVAVDTVMLNLCDYLAKLGPRPTGPDFERYLRMLGDILSRGLEPDPARAGKDLLLDGYQVQERFELQPGPEIGRLLDSLRDGESSGVVRTRAEAYELLARLLGRAASRRGRP